MKIFLNILIIAAGATIGLAVGLALKGKARAKHFVDIRETAKLTSGFSTNPQLKSSFTAVNRGGGRIDDSPLATKLERDLSMSTGVTRWLYWLEALEKARPSDCPRLAELAKGNSPLLRLVASRWAEMDPQHMFDAILARQGGGFPTDEMQRVLFEEWSKRDLEAAIAALGRKDGSTVPANWRRSFAANLVEKNPERGLQLMSEWNVENHLPRMTGVKKWAAANPLHAAEFAMAHAAGHVSRSVMETIGTEWARTAPAAALEYAASKRGELSSILAGSVLKAWTDRNLTEATDWLTKTDAATRNRLSPSFVQGWAKYDAEGALKWSESNLTGINFANAVAGVVKGAVERDLPGAANLVSTMAPSRARGDAAAIVMESWMPRYDSKEGVVPEAVAWLARLDSQSVAHVLQQQQWRWAEADPKSLKTFVASMKAEDVSPDTYNTLARNLARQNPVDALQWANQLPEKNRIAAGTDAFYEWQRSHPSAAQDWLRTLEPKDPRREPFFTGMVSIMSQAPGGTEQLAAMTAAEKVAARAVIEKMPLTEDRRGALLGALQVP